MPYRQTDRTEKRNAAMRQRLVDAASALFAEKGVAASTMREVVARADTSVGNCYFYFRDKDDLLKAVVENVSATIADAIDRTIAGLPFGPELLAAAVYTSIVVALERRDLTRVLLTHAGPELRAATIAGFSARVQRIFEASPGLTHGLDPLLAAHAWQGTAFHLLEEVCIGQLPIDAPSLGRFAARWNLRALGFSEGVITFALAGLDNLDLNEGERM